MLKKIFVILSIFMMLGITASAADTRYGYVEQIDRNGPVILYRLVERDQIGNEMTLGYVKSRGAYHLGPIVEEYTHRGFHFPPYDFVWSYKDYTGKKLPFVICSSCLRDRP